MNRFTPQQLLQILQTYYQDNGSVRETNIRSTKSPTRVGNLSNQGSVSYHVYSSGSSALLEILVCGLIKSSSCKNWNRKTKKRVAHSLNRPPILFTLPIRFTQENFGRPFGSNKLALHFIQSTIQSIFEGHFWWAHYVVGLWRNLQERAIYHHWTIFYKVACIRRFSYMLLVLLESHISKKPLDLSFWKFELLSGAIYS